MGIQYIKGILSFDATLFDADVNGEGLITQCQKSTAGAPANTVGKFVPYAIVQATDGNYENDGTTASPNFVIMATGASGITSLSGDGSATGPGAATFTLSAGLKVSTAILDFGSADITQMFTSPKTLVAAPGTGFFIQPLSIVGRMVFATAAYDTNVNLQIFFDGATNNLAENAYLLGTTAGEVIQPFIDNAPAAVDTSYLVEDAALKIKVATGNPATGAGHLFVTVTYKVVPISL